uniref:Uncharacterized protein n=1 Tax=Arundo donax TaxID=35708 RepID=A0A0A8YAV0_ARUDO
MTKTILNDITLLSIIKRKNYFLQTL